MTISNKLPQTGILTVFALSFTLTGCAYVEGLHNGSVPAEAKKTQGTEVNAGAPIAQPPKPSPATNAAKMISPLT